MTSAAQSQSVPMSVKGGWWKSSTLVPSRKNSGLETTAKSRPASRPEVSAMRRETICPVPGKTVERTATTCRPSLCRNASPICPATFWMAERSR